jgi:hypothetical protein
MQQPKRRFTGRPPADSAMFFTKELPCPECGKKVPVGGSRNGFWTITRHSPNDDVMQTCLGTEGEISVKTSP